MASSPASPIAGVTETPDGVEFALQECTVCWDQACDALVNGDFDRVTALLDIAESHLATIRDLSRQASVDAKLYASATAARSRLEHAMRDGLEGLHDAIVKARQGSKVLHGYNNLGPLVGNRVTSQA